MTEQMKAGLMVGHLAVKMVGYLADQWVDLMAVL